MLGRHEDDMFAVRAPHWKPNIGPEGQTRSWYPALPLVDQMSMLSFSTTLNASRVPSGEKRTPGLYSAVTARSGCIWPVLSGHINLFVVWFPADVD